MSLTCTTNQQATIELLEKATLSSESGKSRPVVVGKTCIYANGGEYYSRVSNANCHYFRIGAVQPNGLVELHYSAHEYPVGQNTRVWSPNFTCAADELVALLAAYTEEGVFVYIREMSSLKRIKE